MQSLGAEPLHRLRRPLWRNVRPQKKTHAPPERGSYNLIHNEQTRSARRARPTHSAKSIPLSQHRQVFWLSDRPTRRAFPPIKAVAHVRLSSPITAAGPRRICTVFPLADRPAAITDIGGYSLSTTLGRIPFCLVQVKRQVAEGRRRAAYARIRGSGSGTAHPFSEGTCRHTWVTRQRTNRAAEATCATRPSDGTSPEDRKEGQALDVPCI